MPISIRGPRAALLLFPLLSPAAALAQSAEGTTPDLVVTGTREGERRSDTPAAISRIGQETIREIRPAHPSELLNRIPGVTVQQTNGEGAIVGIRQPIGTAPVYLYLQDNVPVQAAGFFNHNALYLLNVPQAAGVEVIRGAGTALQGSDAIGGVVNVLTGAPTAEQLLTSTVEAGSYGWLRNLTTLSDTYGNTGLRADVNVTHSDGWRNHTAYDRQSLNLRADVELADGARLRTTIAAGNIQQQTGANSALNRTDYVNSPRLNYFPIAFRHVDGLLATLAYEKPVGDGGLVSITPFLRANTMTLLPSYQLNTDQVIFRQQYASLGAQLRYRQDFAPWRTRVITGLDLDYSPGSYTEDRIRGVRSGRTWTSYANQGRIYDFDVTFLEAAPFVQLETSPAERVRITGGLRYDALGYQYQNNLPTGAFSTTILSGGNFTSTTFYRPGDTDRYYRHLSPNIGATWTVVPYSEGQPLGEVNLFAGYRQAFRIPQVTNLFRQGANADSIHLRPIVADTYEAGLRSGDQNAITWELVAWRIIKRDDVLTSNTGFGAAQTNNGKTEHTGVEASLGWRITREWRAYGALSYAEHRYVNWVSAQGNFSGKDIPAAPRHTALAALDHAPAWAPGLLVGAEAQVLGRYATNDANTFSYNGHTLLNLRGEYAVAPGVKVFARALNVTNARWATLASVTSNQPQYAPGMPFTAFAGVQLTF